MVDWRLLGFDLAVKASNFRRQLQFDLESVRGASDYLDGEDIHAASAEVAANRGRDAWTLAVRVRSENGLEAFSWPSNASGIDVLVDYLAKLERQQAERSRSIDDLMEGSVSSEVAE